MANRFDCIPPFDSALFRPIRDFIPFFAKKVHFNGLIYPRFIHVLPVFEKGGFWHEVHEKSEHFYPQKPVCPQDY